MSWLTFPVAGAAYRKLPSLKDSLTHSYDPDAEVVLCGKVKPRSILEDYAFDTSEQPSCPTCARKLAKLASR